MYNTLHVPSHMFAHIPSSLYPRISNLPVFFFPDLWWPGHRLLPRNVYIFSPSTLSRCQVYCLQLCPLERFSLSTVFQDHPQYGWNETYFWFTLKYEANLNQAQTFSFSFSWSNRLLHNAIWYGGRGMVQLWWVRKSLGYKIMALFHISASHIVKLPWRSVINIILPIFSLLSPPTSWVLPDLMA